MNFRLTAALFGIVFVLGLVLLGLALWEGDTETTGDLLLGGVAGAKAEQIDAVELERADGARLVLKRTGKDRWAIAEPITAPADAAAVTRVVDALLKVRPTTYGELRADPAAHHLAPPSLRVVLREGDKSATLNVGDVTIGGTKAVGFVNTPDRKRPMAVARADLDPLFKDAARTGGAAGDIAKWTNEYRTKQVFSVNPQTGADDVAAIKLTAKGKELALSKAGGGWTFDSPAGWGDAALNGDTSAATPTAITGVRPLLNTVVNLQAGGSDDFIQDPKDLKEYGLNADNPDLIRVELKTKDGPPEVAYIGKKTDAPATPPLPGSPAPAGKVYVRVEGTAGVIRATAGGTLDGLAAVIADPASLRDRDLLKDDLRSRIDAVDVTAGGQTVKLRKATGATEWKLSGGPGDPQTANQTAVKALIDLLAHPRTIKDFPAPNDADFAGAELKAEVKLWADGVEPAADPKAEPQPKGPPTVLQFGKKDAAGVHVRRILPTGAKADFVLPEKVKLGGGGIAGPAEDVDVLAAVTKPRLGYLDPSLKGFSTLQANRLTVSQGPAVTVEVVAEKPTEPTPGSTGKWKFVKPDAQKDRPADADTVGELVNQLAILTAGRFVAEQPTDPDLVKWGLDPKAPRLKVVVGETGKETVYSFGNETDDKQSVYARQEGRPAVFTIPKLVFEKFAAVDLRDRTVVRFDKAKVKALRLKGWQKTAGFAIELGFERKGSEWAAVKSPGAYAVDPVKIDRFLDALSGLRAKAFLAGPPKPEYNLIPEAGGLQVEVDVEGSPTVLLFIGGPTDNDASYYVQSSTLPAGENLFTVPSDLFKAYKDSSAAFAK